jgi:hypothetical protein
VITTELSCPVSKPSDDHIPEHDTNDHVPTKKNKLEQTSDMCIWFERLGCCCNTLRYINLGEDMTEISFLERVRNKFHLSHEDAGAKIELISESTQQVEWTISSKQEDQNRWPNYREDLFKQRDERGICDGVYAVVTCSDLCSAFGENLNGLQGPCSRKVELVERPDKKIRGRWARRRRDM